MSSSLSAYSVLSKEYLKSKRRVLKDIQCTRAIRSSLVAAQSSFAPAPPPSSPFLNTELHAKIEELLALFDEKKLLNELLSVSYVMLQSLDAQAFADVSSALSNQHIDLATSNAIFERSMRSPCASNAARWNSLVTALLSKMRRLFLAERLLSCGLLALAPLLPALSPHSRSAPLPRRLAVSPVRKPAHSRSANQSSASTPKGRERVLLRHLEASQARLREMAVAEASVLARTASSLGAVPLPSAARFSRHAALRRAEAALRRKGARLLGLAFGRWARATRAHALELAVVVPALRRLACGRLARWLGSRRRRLLFGSFCVLFEHLRVRQLAEYAAACVELQRCVRGWLARLRLRAARLTAATTRLVRGLRLRGAFLRMRALYCSLGAARAIQRWHRRRRRSTRIRSQLRARMVRRSVLLLQRSVRGWLAVRGLAGALRDRRLRGTSATRIQAWQRMRGPRHAYRLLLRSARAVQREWRAHRLRSKYWHRALEYAVQAALLEARLHRAARVIQTQARAYLERRRRPPEQRLADWRLAFAACLALVRVRGLLCYLWRRRLERRQARRLRSTNAALRLRQQLHAGAIQRVYRGFSSRRATARLLLDYRRDLHEKLKATPAYYRLQTSYLATQNLLYRSPAMKIQSTFRMHLAKRVAAVRRRAQASRSIGRSLERRAQVQAAKRVALGRRAELELRLRRVVRAQSLVRRWLARLYCQRRRSADTVAWLLLRQLLATRVFKAVLGQKKRLRVRAATAQAALRIQSLARRYLARVEFLKLYRKRVRARANREKRLRTDAGVRIQTAARSFLAKRKVAKRRKAYAEEKRLRDLDSFFESHLDALHEEFLGDLHAVKAQTAVRSLLARKRVEQRVAELETHRRATRERRVMHGVRSLQAMVRGKRSRAAGYAGLDSDELCAECEYKAAVKRCVECDDSFCFLCFDNMHSKGNRTHHTFEQLCKETVKLRSVSASSSLGREGDSSVESESLYSSYVSPRGDDSAPVDALPAVHADDSFAAAAQSYANGEYAEEQDTDKYHWNTEAEDAPFEWEEYWDDGAQAKYWFNNATGEATWLTPYTTLADPATAVSQDDIEIQI